MYAGFEKWIDKLLEENMPLDGVAVCINLYEEGDSEWAAQLITAPSFDEEDDEWCCDEVFSSEEDLFIWKQKGSWEEALKKATDALCDYLTDGKYAEDLKEYEAIAIGFVDGDLDIVYKNE